MFLLLIYVVIAQKPACQWQDKQGYSYDISGLHKPENYEVPDTDTSMGMFNMVYAFNFCGGSVKCQGREVAAYEALEVMGKVTENCDVLGTRETQEFGHLNPLQPETGITITYKQGDMCFDVKDDAGLEKMLQDNEQMSMSPRSVTFEIMCGRDEQTFKVIDSSKCNIRMGITHSAACRTSSSSGSSWFKYFVILFVIYLLSGYAYNNRTKDLKGTEAIPNIDFWRRVPFMLKDGINLLLLKSINLIRKARGLQEQGGYSIV